MKVADYDIKAELRKWGALKVGDPVPNDWGPTLTKLLNDAADRIYDLETELWEAAQDQ